MTDLVHRADPSTGLTALHWAALYGQEEIITLLMTQCAGALDVWLHSRAGANQVRPQELWAIRHRPEQLAQSSLKHEERGGAAPGHGVLAQLALNLVESPVLIVGLVVLLALEGTWLCAVQEDAITWALLLMTSCLFFSAVCWTHYKAVRQDLETEFRAAGVNLSWSLQPLDKAFASAVYAYHTSRLTWVDHICSAINLGLPLTFPQQVALWNKKFVSPGMLSCQLTWLILGFTIRYYFAKRGNFKSLQWMNAVLDTSLYVFYAALSVCGLLSGSHLDTNLTGLQAVGSLGWLMVLNVTFATLVAIPQAIRTPFPMDSVLGIRFISQVLQTAWFMLTRASAQRTGRPVLPLGTCLGTWLVASILSSTLLIVLRLNVERSNGMKFMRHWTEMSKRM